MELTPEQFAALAEKVGVEAARQIKAEADAGVARMKALQAGTLSPEQFLAEKQALEASVATVKDIATKQGLSITEILGRLDNPKGAYKSVAEQLSEDKAELQEIFRSKSRNKEYMLNVDAEGKWYMQPFDRIKAAGPHATANDVTTAGNLGSVTQNFSAATLLRMAGDSPINSVYRNTPWIFDLVNLINVGYDQKFFTWFDELAVTGSSANVLEGGTKPLVQYRYQLNNSNYLKEAMLVSFTEEFDLDFGRLEDDIIKKSRIDLINRINQAILPRITTAAVAYNQGATYAPTGDKVANPNDWDVIAALAAQSENATFSTQANTAVVSTNKKYRMATLKDSQNNPLRIPEILQNIALVSNPSVTTGNVLVGDFKQYNVALRGGIIVRVGYNGTDFAENKFSVAIEQFYFDYISALRTPAIVKGPDFATVKTAIGITV